MTANGNVVLEEEVDVDYVPTEKEIQEYAEWLGMNLDEDGELLWIAREGLMAPLPKPWKPCQSSANEIFYFNFETGESVWDHPVDEHFRTMYREAKEARAAQPARVLTLGASLQDDGALAVTCTNMAGDELVVLPVKPKRRVRTLAEAISAELKVPKRVLRLVLPDGTLLADVYQEARLSSLAPLFGFPLEASGEGKEGKEGKDHEKKESKLERRARKKERKEAPRPPDLPELPMHTGTLGKATSTQLPPLEPGDVQRRLAKLERQCAKFEAPCLVPELRA